MSANPGDFGGGEADIVAEINVTPLTDIFLVLLIIFMVTSTALSQQASNVNLPRADATGVEPRGVVVTAAADGRIELNGKPVLMEELEAALAALFQGGTEHNVVLRGDRSLVLEQAVQIMTVAKRAGADKFSIATTPLERQGSPRR